MFWNIQEDDKGETIKEKQQHIIQVLNLKRVHTRYILDPTVREAAIKNIDTLYTRARRKNKKVIWVKKRKYGALTFVPFEKSLLSLPHKEYSLFLKPINDKEDESESFLTQGPRKFTTEKWKCWQ